MVSGTTNTWERFNLQHIVNHELAHVFTGLEDGPQHNGIANAINSETDGGPPRYDYESVRPVNDPIFDFCFSAKTAIMLHDGTEKPISEITVGDIVATFIACADVSHSRVTQLLHSVTDTWLHLSNGTHVTPGHRYLRADGSFAEIQDILADDGRIVAADGSVQTVTAEVIRYSAETAHLFEEAEMLVYAGKGGAALAREIGQHASVDELDVCYRFSPVTLAA